MVDDIILKIENVTKMYKLGQIGGTTLHDELQRFSAKVRHKEDPTQKIGAKDCNRSKTFMALDGISFEVKKGERVGIIGHNGAGKSTLLKLISRVTAPTNGTICMSGRVASMLEVGTGFHGELTGRENIYMNGAILGMTKKEIAAKIEDIIEFSECRKFIDTPVKRYSSGMYVKLAFSVAAHLDSEIMIMDEVLAVGDMAFQKKCLDKMNDVSKTIGRTILYVSHNMNTIRQLCDRVIVLDHGKIVFDGEVEEGIEIYMDAAKDHRTFFDYCDCPHPPNEKRSLKMLTLELLGVETNRIIRGTDLCFTLQLKALDNIDDVYYRLEIFYADNSIAGTAFTQNGISAKKGEMLNVTMKLDTRNFAPGNYLAAGLLFETDQYGNQVPLDRVYPALTFEIIEQCENSIIWLHQLWGHTRYNNIIIDKIDFRTE